MSGDRPQRYAKENECRRAEPSGMASGLPPAARRMPRALQHLALVAVLALAAWISPWLIRLETSRYELRVACSSEDIRYSGSVGMFQPPRGRYAWSIYGRGSRTFDLGRGTEVDLSLHQDAGNGSMTLELRRDGAPFTRSTPTTLRGLVTLRD